jgi:hypothetical protein
VIPDLTSSKTLKTRSKRSLIRLEVLRNSLVITMVRVKIDSPSNKHSGHQVELVMITPKPSKGVSNTLNPSSNKLMNATNIPQLGNLNSRIVICTIIQDSSSSSTHHPESNNSNSTLLPKDSNSNSSSTSHQAKSQSKLLGKELNQVLTQDLPQVSPQSNCTSLQVAVLKSVSDEFEITSV